MHLRNETLFIGSLERQNLQLRVCIESCMGRHADEHHLLLGWAPRVLVDICQRSGGHVLPDYVT